MKKSVALDHYIARIKIPWATMLVMAIVMIFVGGGFTDSPSRRVKFFVIVGGIALSSAFGVLLRAKGKSTKLALIVMLAFFALYIVMSLAQGVAISTVNYFGIVVALVGMGGMAVILLRRRQLN